MSKITDITLYLKYYIGRPVTVTRKSVGYERLGQLISVYHSRHNGEPHNRVVFTSNGIYYEEFVLADDIEVTLHLRTYSDLTTEEWKELDRIEGKTVRPKSRFNHQIGFAKFWTPDQTHYLLSIGVDIFGLIEAGLAKHRTV